MIRIEVILSIGNRAATALCVASCSLVLLAGTGNAGTREQARRIHDRLVGIPPSEAVLASMEADVIAGDPVAAGMTAMQDPHFYTTTLKNWVTPWTNQAETIFAPLNDYTATVIGMIRDDVPFTEVLSADLVYMGAPTVVPSAYSHTDNDHYQQLEDNDVDLSNPALLIGVQQSTLPGSQLSEGDTAGVVTTRAAGAEFFTAGTNRRMFRYTSMNYLCRDMEALHDITRAADRIRQDVNRSPGGDSSIFHNSCVGCHNGMDPMAGAYAYYEWDPDDGDGRTVYTPGQVQPKYVGNATAFPFGYITTSNRWDNYWRNGQNSVLDWRGPNAGGFGAKSLGVEIASTRAFSVCQVEKVFEQTCFHPPGNPTERAEVDRIADVFEAQNFSMRRVFAETAAYCMGN